MLASITAEAQTITHADRIKDTTTTTGTGNITVTGTAPTGFRPFSTFSTVTPDYFHCAIVGTSQWEISRCHMISSTVMVRDELLSSSTGSTVSFSAGTKTVFATLASSWLNDLGTSSYLSLAGGTMTGGIVSSGVPVDVTTGTNEDYTIDVDGAGRVQLNDEMQITAGGFSMLLTANGSVGQSISGTASDGAILGLLGGPTGAVVAMKTDIAVNDRVLNVQDQRTTTVGGISLFTVYGGGAFGVTNQQSITISTGTNTVTPSSSHVELTCTTAPCDYRPGNSGVRDGWDIKIVNNEAIGGDDITITDNSSTTDTVTTRGRATITLVPGDSSRCAYNGSRWGCQ